MTEQDLALDDNPDESRYEATDDGSVVALAGYHRHGETIIFTHTEVDEAYEGQGVGGRLVRFALDDVRSRGLVVVARCPFVHGWIGRHPDYADLLRH